MFGVSIIVVAVCNSSVCAVSKISFHEICCFQILCEL
jgi:hypothetical protein